MDEILNLISTCRKVNDIKPVIREFMDDKIGKYPAKWTLMQSAHHEIYRFGSVLPAVCPVFGSTLKFMGLKAGYPKNCSHKCRAANLDVLRKYKETCLARYGVEYASQSEEFRQTVKESSFEKYGVDNVFKNKAVREKYNQTIQEKYGVENVSKSNIILAKIRESHIQSGNWIPDDQKSEIERYRIEVARFTARSYYDYYYLINPTNLERSRYQYHLDHIFSVDEGFKQGISAEIIGHYSNLRMLWHLDNCIKNTKCHKTKKQLLEDFYRK